MPPQAAFVHTLRTALSLPREFSRVKLLKYILVALLIASMAAVEFMHELANDDPPDGAVQVAPEAGQESTATPPLHHLHSH